MAKKKPTEPELVCKGCGVCCVSLGNQLEYCDVFDAEYLSMSKAQRKHVKIFNALDQLIYKVYGAIKTAYVRNTQGPLKGYEVSRCYFLKKSLLHSAYCSIYANRPYTCKVSVTPGDRNCKILRERFLDYASSLKK